MAFKWNGIQIYTASTTYIYSMRLKVEYENMAWYVAVILFVVFRLLPNGITYALFITQISSKK